MIRKSVVLLFLLLLIMQLTACSQNNSAQEKLQLANKYLSEENYEQAIIAFNEVIKIDAKIAAAYQGLAKAYKGLNKPQEAEKVLLTGIEKATDPDPLRIDLGNLYFEQGLFEKAVAIFEGITDKSKMDSESVLNMRNAYIEIGKPEMALEAMTALLENATTIRGKFNAALSLGKLEIEIGSNVHAENIDNPVTVSHLDKALEYLNIALKNAQSDEEKYSANFYIALSYNNHVDQTQSIVFCQQALVFAKTNHEKNETYSLMAMGYANQGEYAKAIDFYNKAIEFSEEKYDTFQSMMALGAVYAEEKKFSRAIEIYSQARAYAETDEDYQYVEDSIYLASN